MMIAKAEKYFVPLSIELDKGQTYLKDMGLG